MAIATMALALGANTAVVSVLEAFLGSSFGLEEPDRVVIVAPVLDLPGRGEVVFADAYSNYLLIRDAQRSFDAVACVLQGVSSWDDGTETRAVPSAKVTASFFAATGVQPQLGRAFREEEEGPGPAAVIIVSHALWRDALAGDPNVLGRVMTLDGAPHTIIGVMPPEFAHPLITDVWIPFDIPPAARTGIVGARNLTVFAHLRADVSEADAAADMTALTQAALEADAQNDGYRYRIVTIGEFVLPNADRTVVFVQIGALLLTLLAVVNLSSLLMAWGHDRRHEMAVRVALGGRGRSIARMLVLQSLVVVLTGAACGALLARVAVTTIAGMDVGPQFAIYLGQLTLDGSVLAWSAALAGVAGVLASILPAVFVRKSAIGASLRTARGSQSPLALRWQKALVLAQASLAVLIFSTAALIGMSFRNLARVPDGFAPEGQLVARVQLTSVRYQAVAERIAFVERLEEAMRREPELSEAGLTSTLPVSDQRFGTRVRVELADGSFEPEPLLIHIRRVSDGYFGAIDLPLQQGRAFDARDGTSTPLVTVVSESLARRLWPREDAVGQIVHRVVGAEPAPRLLEVIGVVEDAMDGGYQAPPGETIYVPWTQDAVTRLSIVVRPRTSPEPALAALRRALRAADPQLAAGAVAELSGLVRSETALPRLQTALLLTFAIVAGGIVALGSYGLMSQLVATREREFAVRLAVGAATGRIGSQVWGQAARITGPGVAAGLGASWLVSGAVSPFLFGVDARSFPVMAAVAAGTLLLLAVATLPTAVRAMRVKVTAALG
jgi:predicted permease